MAKDKLVRSLLVERARNHQGQLNMVHEQVIKQFDIHKEDCDDMNHSDPVALSSQFIVYCRLYVGRDN